MLSLRLQQEEQRQRYQRREQCVTDPAAKKGVYESVHEFKFVIWKAIDEENRFALHQSESARHGDKLVRTQVHPICQHTGHI